MTTILVIDDDAPLRRALRTSLVARGYDVTEASTGEAGVRLVTDERPDLVVLDLGLPDQSGIVVIERVRAISAVPVLVLTARDVQAQKVDALDAGADDYVTKPFDPPELMARVRASLRRSTSGPLAERIERGAVTIDLRNKVLTFGGETVALTRTEWSLLDLLAHNPGRLLTHATLLQAVWGPEYGTESNYLRTFVGQLRKKLRDSAASPTFIATEPGIGYRWLGDRDLASPLDPPG